MYVDTVVIAGIGTVLLMLGFFVGVGIFVIRDSKRSEVVPGAASESSEKAIRKSRI
ncbi:cytochrome c oxidase subunit CcoM [Marinobacter sp.]|uniref:cytochrome c oxidase subunit CcoM n=1 Tax=Marinobacter sp. TaxID=50741 RepID=UPI003B51E883